MCLTAPGRVIAVSEGLATVQLADARTVGASVLVEPDTRPGDWVIVAAGTILRRLDPDEATAIAAAVATASERPTFNDSLPLTRKETP